MSSDQESHCRSKSGQRKTHGSDRRNNGHNNGSKGAASNSISGSTSTISYDEVTIGRTVGGGGIEVGSSCIEARASDNGGVGGHTLIVVVAKATSSLESASVASFNDSCGSLLRLAAACFCALLAQPFYALILETCGSGRPNNRAVGIRLTGIAVWDRVAHTSCVRRRAGPVGALVDLRLTRAVGVVLTRGAKRIRLHVGTNATTTGVIASIDSAGVVIVTVRVIVACTQARRERSKGSVCVQSAIGAISTP